MLHSQTLFLNAADGAEMQTALSTFLQQHPSSLVVGFASSGLHELIATTECLAHSPCVIGSSCLGAGNEQSMQVAKQSLSLIALRDPEGCFGVASSSITPDSAKANAAQVTLAALKRAGKLGSTPKMIWCMQTPGMEEQVLEGIQSVVGKHVPVFGGSSADDEVKGAWWVADSNHIMQSGVVIAVMFPSQEVAGYFSNGYALTTLSGEVTAIKGRQLQQIDQQPALVRYNQWRTEIGLQPLHADNIEAGSLTPIARVMRGRGDESVTLLCHPAGIDGNTLQLFSNLEEGEQVYLAFGEPSKLAQRAGEVVRDARDIAKYKHITHIKGAIVILCGGYMMNVKDSLALVHDDLQQALQGIPYIVGFTFGEIGAFSDGTTRHGNLMLSCLLFGDSHA